MDIDFYRFLAFNTPQLFNDTPGEPVYAVKIRLANPAVGEWYWQLALAHMLTGQENHGQGNLFIEALDENGQPVRRPFNYPVIAWDWEGRREWEGHPSFGPDKGLGEPGGNIAIHWGQRLEAWIELDGLKSDRVCDVHTMWPDGETGITRGHVSSLAVFVKRRHLVTLPPDDEEPPPVEPDRLAALVTEIEAVLARYK